MAATGTDPRSTFAPGSETDVRPVIARPSPGLPVWILIGGMIFAAALLFSVLDARRRAATAPTTKPRVADTIGTPVPITPLYIPPVPHVDRVVLVPITEPTAAPTLAPRPPAPPPMNYTPPPVASFEPPIPAPQPQRTSLDPVLVFDASNTAAAPVEGSAAPAGEGVAAVAATGVRAAVIRHLPTLVPQGTLIQAVLETALDSTRPGPVRALVARNVRGFDGSRVLIPRGSRLIGDYRADLEPGQNRALITWTRLIRPDGVTIAIGSPAGDPLGRVGVRGKVNSHFLERFGAALLQTSLYIGSNYASQLGNSAVIIAAPGTAQNLASPLTSGAPIRPTLRVKQGAAITVFVARDLDFTAVESRK